VGFSNEEAMAMVQEQLEHQVENGTTSRGAFDTMLKQRGYGQSGMLHTHVVSSRCSSIWSQIQNGVLGARSDDTKSLKGVGLNWISSRDISLNCLLQWHVMLIEGDAIGQSSHPLLCRCVYCRGLINPTVADFVLVCRLGVPMNSE
jgi:hypothetical protein